MKKIEILKESLLKKYSGTISYQKKITLLSKLKKFNIKEGTNFYIEFGQHGKSSNYTWIAIKKAGKNGDVIYVKKITEKLKKILGDKVTSLKNNLKSEVKSYTQSSLQF